MKEMMKRKDLGLKTMQKTREKLENIDTHTLLKRRLQKIIFNNKDKVKIIDQYIKNMQYIDEAFTQVKDATGITDVEEIVNTFIKSEEQNLSLMNYASLLSQDIDMFEEMNKDLAREIEELEFLKRQRVQEIEGNEQEKEKKRLKNIIETKRKDIAMLKQRIEDLQAAVEPILTHFHDSKLNHHVLGKYNYDAGVYLNENNVEQYLSEFEDYLDTFLIFQAKLHETPNNPYILKPGMWEEMDIDSGDITRNQVIFTLLASFLNIPFLFLKGMDTPFAKEPNLKEIGHIIDNSQLEGQFLKWDDLQNIASDTLEKKKQQAQTGGPFGHGPQSQPLNTSIQAVLSLEPSLPFSLPKFSLAWSVEEIKLLETWFLERGLAFVNSRPHRPTCI